MHRSVLLFVSVLRKWMTAKCLWREPHCWSKYYKTEHISPLHPCGCVCAFYFDNLPEEILYRTYAHACYMLNTFEIHKTCAPLYQ